MTDNVIPFPIKDKSSLQEALTNIRRTYLNAGLSEADADAAILELRPLLQEFVGDRFESTMTIPADCALTSEQLEIITTAHNKCVQEIFSHFSEKLGIAACVVAGLVARRYDT